MLIFDIFCKNCRNMFEDESEPKLTTELELTVY